MDAATERQASLPVIDMPLVTATAETLAGYGELLREPDTHPVEIVRRPAQGWRPVDPDTGDQGGTTEGIFEFWLRRPGPLLRQAGQGARAGELRLRPGVRGLPGRPAPAAPERIAMRSKRPHVILLWDERGGGPSSGAVALASPRIQSRKALTFGVRASDGRVTR